MGTIADRIRARLESAKAARDASSEGTNVSASNTGNTASSAWDRRLLSQKADYESAKFNLNLACYLNIKGRSVCYPNYMEAGLAVCDTLLPVELVDRWFKSYCLEPYPDVCRCGQMFFGSSNSLRDHCIICRGSVNKLRVDSYTIQRLAQHTGVHYSWIEFAAAWALTDYRSS